MSPPLARGPGCDSGVCCAENNISLHPPCPLTVHPAQPRPSDPTRPRRVDGAPGLLLHPADLGRTKRALFKISSPFTGIINPYPQALIMRAAAAAGRIMSRVRPRCSGRRGKGGVGLICDTEHWTRPRVGHGPDTRGALRLLPLPRSLHSAPLPKPGGDQTHGPRTRTPWAPTQPRAVPCAHGRCPRPAVARGAVLLPSTAGLAGPQAGRTWTS